MGSAVLLRSKATSRQRKSSSPIRSASSTSTSPKCRPPRESSTSSWRSTELRSSVDRHEEVELSLGGLHFGDVDVEEADRIGLELFLCRLVAFDLSKTADPMPLQTTMQ